MRMPVAGFTGMPFRALRMALDALGGTVRRLPRAQLRGAGRSRRTALEEDSTALGTAPEETASRTPAGTSRTPLKGTCGQGCRRPWNGSGGRSRGCFLCRNTARRRCTCDSAIMPTGFWTASRAIFRGLSLFRIPRVDGDTARRRCNTARRRSKRQIYRA